MGRPTGRQRQERNELMHAADSRLKVEVYTDIALNPMNCVSAARRHARLSEGRN
jgi:hypothetical protein